MGIYNIDEFLAISNDLLLPQVYCDNDIYTSEKQSYEEFVKNGYSLDKTEFESLINHIHLDMCFDYNTVDDLREAGLAIAKIWVSRLKFEFPDKHFFVYLTVEEGDGEETLTSSTLRFCLKRDDEPAWSDNEPDGKTFFVWQT